MTNRTWIYENPEDYHTIKTDREILDERWDWWKERMIKKYGADSELITEENCIQDWVTMNWAWEYKDV